jgi:hypothetical protein
VVTGRAARASIWFQVFLTRRLDVFSALLHAAPLSMMVYRERDLLSLLLCSATTTGFLESSSAFTTTTSPTLCRYKQDLFPCGA